MCTHVLLGGVRGAPPCCMAGDVEDEDMKMKDAETRGGDVEQDSAEGGEQGAPAEALQEASAAGGKP